MTLAVTVVTLCVCDLIAHGSQSSRFVCDLIAHGSEWWDFTGNCVCEGPT